MRDLDSELAYFRMKIARDQSQAISDGAAIPDEVIASTVRAGPFHLSDEETAHVVRQLEESFTTTQHRGSAVFSEFKPWLRDRRGQIDFYYWSRLQKYYMEGDVLPPQVVATLDKDTDEILDFSGDPRDPGIWSRRGMVMGHVQSGKTTNYSALICKAADAGYKIIILLAGITNTLRSQTQERMDATFIGKKSVFQAVAQEPLPIQMYASGKRFPAYGTSRDRDFTRDAAGVFFGLEAHNEPIIFVTKKNKAPLERLSDWLTEQGHGGKLEAPLLLIDDEADNASINTASSPGATTAINTAIRQILALFQRSSYVGYTATPFANIFIDPDSQESMLRDDLFPRHFIKELDPPSNYVGAARVFADEGNLRGVMVRQIDDYAAILPLNHKRDCAVEDLPDSLYRAVRVFVLTRAIRIVRGQGNKHCSMLINVSRFNDVQEKVYGLVWKYLTTLKDAVSVYAGLGLGGLSDKIIMDLKADFDREFEQAGTTFAAVLAVLHQAAETIRVMTINMKGGRLDYSQNREKGLHVIAIGGLALSRGLTLEDLTVSYILRNTVASDTLMQMARWFGYRPGFEDLCRLYLPTSSLQHYEYIHEAIEELRSEVKRMQIIGLTPADFGLKVRQSPTAIRVTAANKMRTASAMTLAQDYSARHVEGYVLANNDDMNRANLDAVRRFIASLGARDSQYSDVKTVVWRGIPGQSVVALLRSFRFPEAHPDLGIISGDTSLLIDYVRDRLTADLAAWDVAIPHPATGPFREDVIPGCSFPLRARESGSTEGAEYRVTGRKNRVADPDDAQIGLSDAQKEEARKEREAGTRRGESAYCAQRERPLLIIHIFDTRGKTKGMRIKDPVVSLSFCLPQTMRSSVPRTYQVNIVYRRQTEQFASEQEDDDAVIDRPDDV